MTFLKHPALLWLSRHAQELLPLVTPSLQARFDEGYTFEPYVEALFPDIVKLDFVVSADHKSMADRTLEVWKGGATAVAQGHYETESLTCTSDILSHDNGVFVLTEIKSSTSVRPEHIFDLAFQCIVLAESGFHINRCQVAHVNRNYLRVGDIDPHELVSIADVSREVEEQIENTRTRIGLALSVAHSESMPDPSPERASPDFYAEWLQIREAMDPPIPENSIYQLPSITAETASALIAAGITTIDDVEDTSVLGASAKRYLSARANGARTINRDALDCFLGQIDYPLHFLDYETTQSLLPPWDGVRPYQQVPFQYSLHIQNEPGGIVEHREYLHREESIPIPNLLEKLSVDMGANGTVLVWYEPFEKSRNKEMASFCPSHSDFLHNVNARIVDLMQPFSDNTVKDPAFMGSASIKKVLPAFVPELSYNDLEIQEGESASRVWKDVTLIDPDSPKREKVYSDLVAYCARDTWAMVAIMKELLVA